MGGPNEPYWRTNTSFSPPLSRRWDHTFQSEGPPNAVPHPHLVYGPSSLSSNSNKDSQSWLRGDDFPLHYSASEGVLSYMSSPSADSFPTQPWTPTPLPGGPTIDDYNPAAVREPVASELMLIRLFGLSKKLVIHFPLFPPRMHVSVTETKSVRITSKYVLTELLE
ncbi:hypothetical protein ACLOJK_029179 [Asimina triloba]